MTFASTETSVDDARPIEMFKIAYSGSIWTFTTAEEPVTFFGLTYQSMPIQHEEIKNSTATERSDFSFRMPITTPIGELFRVQPPSELVSLEIFARHYSFPEGEYALIWKGRITDARWEGPEIIFNTSSIFASLRRTGLRERWQKTCPYVLYGMQCGVNASDYVLETTVLGISGLDVIAQAAVGSHDTLYAGGYLTYINPAAGNTERRGIRTVVGSTGAMRLGSIPTGLTPGMTIQLYPGCDHTMGSYGCKRFNNELNYGGRTIFRPAKNPFGGSTIW